MREILPPVGLQDDEIDRDEKTDEPKKIVEKEPQSVATFVEFMGTPSAYWFRGPRYAVYFGKIMSGKAKKSKYQLMTYQNDIRKILFDPYNATQLATELAETDGLPVEFLRQGFLSLSDPTKQLERLVKSRKIRHGNNPVLNWMIGNALVEQELGFVIV